MVMIMEGGGAGSCIGTYYYTYFKRSLFTFHSFYPVFFIPYSGKQMGGSYNNNTECMGEWNEWGGAVSLSFFPFL